MAAINKTQPWKASWEAQKDAGQRNTACGIDYGVSKGDIAVVDGTAANVKPKKTQPWRAAWPPAEQKTCPNGVEYGVAKGDVTVVDGTVANVKPAKGKTSS